MLATSIMVLMINIFLTSMKLRQIKVECPVWSRSVVTDIRLSGKRKRKNKKKESAKKDKEAAIAKPSQQINRFFNNSALKAALKPKPAPVSWHVYSRKNTHCIHSLVRID